MDQTSSPIVDEIEQSKPDLDGMDFFEAMKLVLLGKKVHKLDWEDHKFYLQLHEGRLRLHKPDGKWYDFIMSETDMLGNDYIQIF